MEVILLKDVEKLGKRGDVVKIRDGFGRNFLLPRRLACPATRENRTVIEIERKRATQRRVREGAEAETLAQKIGSLRLRLEVAVGEKDKLYGSVTSQDLAQALAREGVSLGKKQFRLPEPIRSLGTHAVPIELEAGVKATLQVEIIKKS